MEGPNGTAVLRDASSTSHSRGNYRDDSGDGDDMSREGGVSSTNPHPLRGDDGNEIGTSAENGFLHRSVDPRVLREAAHVSETMSPGGLDRGGMWEYARTMRAMQRDGKMPPLRVEGSSSDEKKVRRRRRK